MCTSTEKILLSLVYGSEVIVLSIRKEVFKEKKAFHSIFKRINEGILGHSTRKSSLKKMKVGDLVLK